MCAQVYSYATSLSGPWSKWAEFADDGSNTYHSQVSFILPWGDSAIYMGDRWHPGNLMRSTYVWLPLELTGETNIWLTNRPSWVPDVSSRTWAVGPEEGRYEGEDATLTNGAVAVGCSGCEGGRAAGYIGGEGGGVLEWDGVSSGATTRTTLRVRYANGNSVERHAMVSVNGVEQRVAFLPTANGNTPGSSAVHCDLREGADNRIVVTTHDGSYGPDIDRVFVPVS